MLESLKVKFILNKRARIFKMEGYFSKYPFHLSSIENGYQIKTKG